MHTLRVKTALFERVVMSVCSALKRFCQEEKGNHHSFITQFLLCIKRDTQTQRHTRTHTHIHTQRERERERERQTDRHIHKRAYFKTQAQSK